MRIALLSLLVALAPATSFAKKKKDAPPEDGLPSVEDVGEQVKTVYDELAENSDPLVRRAVFLGRLALDDETRAKAIEAGLAESDWAVRGEAMALSFGKPPKKAAKLWKPLRKTAEEALTKMLESGDEADFEHGLDLLKAHFNPKDQLKWLQKAAKMGAPDGRQRARQAILAGGGKPAWEVIKAGLAEPADSQEHQQAVEALKGFVDPLALDWAMKRMHDEDAYGAIARDLLVAMDDKKAVAKMEKALRKTYEKSADYETRLRIASVLARRGDQGVTRTLIAGFRFHKKTAKAHAWAGLAGVRDLATLGKLRALIASNDDPEQADAAYAWLTAWAKASGEKKVFELLQEVAKGDRRELRLRAMAALTELKHRASAPLFEDAMTEGQKEVRLAGAKGLAAVSRPGDEDRINAFLRKEPDTEVKAALIDALANIGTPEIIDPLQFVMMAPQRELKHAAALAVARTGTPKAAERLALLKRDPDVEIRFIVWHKLLQLKPRETMAELKSAVTWLTPAQVKTLGDDPQVSEDALELMAKEGGDELRHAAVLALEARGEKGVTKLLGLVESPHPDTAAQALVALSKQRKDASNATYRKALQSKHGNVRAAAFEALGAWGTRPSLELVMPGMADREPLARAHAAAAAYQLAGREAAPPT